MTIPLKLQFEGTNKEFQFRDNFLMPLIKRLGYGIVANYHGQREFGRDIIFGDIDRFGHLVYYGMQVKYDPSVSQSASHELINDAVEATLNPFRHPQTGSEDYISCFYVANAGSISDQAKENFFNALPSRGIRNAKLLDGNALLLLDKAAYINRTADIKERAIGLLQEVRRNRSVAEELKLKMNEFIKNGKPFPMQRFRNSASGSYLNSPFPISDVSIDTIDQYWELSRMVNDVSDSVGTAFAAKEYREARINCLLSDLIPTSSSYGISIEKAIIEFLNTLDPFLKK